MNLKNTLGKTFVTGMIALWLAGCASHGPSGMSGMTGHSGPGDTMTGSMTQGVNESGVDAVVRSGQISGTTADIAQLLSKDTYYFQFDSNAINANDYKSLQAQAALLKTPEYKTVNLVIEGNTDQRGTRNYNMALGLRRANAVRDYLVAQGVHSNQIRVISYGFEKPADPDNNPVAWAKNRRAHLVFQNRHDVSL